MTIVRTLVVLSVLVAHPALAQQVDISGEWAARVHEDQPHRGPGAELGDYTGLPINDAARQKASHWDASILSLPERMAQPHPAVYFMRGPGPNMRIEKRVDPVTHELIAYTLEGVFGRNDRIIWMDGRPHPSPNAEYPVGRLLHREGQRQSSHHHDDAHEVRRDPAQRCSREHQSEDD